MSRIYEALQKAESEREKEPLPPPAEPFAESSTAAASEFAAPASLHEPQEFVRSRYSQASTFAEPAFEPVDELPPSRYATAASVASPIDDSFGPPVFDPPAHVAGGIDFESIERHDWKPQLEKLPSLQDRGPSVEQFRSLRSRLVELRDQRPLKSILVTSGLPQEGKSFIATNLAISLLRHRNNRVLLIDGDMRRYTVHELLGTNPHPGLADYLSGNASLNEILQRCNADGNMPGPLGASKAMLANLAFIPGGVGGDRAADLSGSPRFPELLRTLSDNYDWIIIDSSPVLPVSDAVNLARSADGVLMVARGGVTKYSTAQKAASELRAANQLGFVLNAVHETPHVGHYYGYNAGTK
jgi:protein-tyrosine kinase